MTAGSRDARHEAMIDYLLMKVDSVDARHGLKAHF